MTGAIKAWFASALVFGCSWQVVHEIGEVPGATALLCTLFVSVDGADDSAGDLDHPLATLQRAADLAAAGDTVCIRKGRYAGPMIRKSGASGMPITFRNYPGESPIVESRIELQAPEGFQFAIGWIVIEGLEISGAYNGIKFNSGHDILIRGNYIHDSPQEGILGWGYKIMIDGNIVARTGTPSTGAIGGTGTEFKIINNVIHSTFGYGITAAGYPFDSAGAPGPEYAGARGWLISNNVVAFGQNSGGITVWQPDAAADIIQNNIFYRNNVPAASGAGQGIDFYFSGGGHLVRNNLYYPSDVPAVSETSAGLYNEVARIEADPRFRNAAGFDFTLLGDSLALDAGTSLDTPDHDLAGRARPRGAGYDIGAYESQ